MMPKPAVFRSLYADVWNVQAQFAAMSTHVDTAVLTENAMVGWEDSMMPKPAVFC